MNLKPSKSFVVSLLYFITRLAIAALFLYSGVVKMADPGRFLGQIMGLDLVPYWIAYPTALILPCLEVICGIFLLTFTFTCAATLLLMLMMIGFMTFLTIVHEMGINTNCGCFGDWVFIGGYWLHILLNAAVFGLLCVHFERSARLQILFDMDNKE
jgi:uncharacterized membrane protein YphA (DoxX/SURF4 family)